MFHPHSSLRDFELDPAPGVSVSISKGGAFEDIFSGKEALLPIVNVDGIDIGYSPAEPGELPTIGISKGILSAGPAGNALIAVSATSGWDFPIFMWQGSTRR